MGINKCAGSRTTAGRDMGYSQASAKMHAEIEKTHSRSALDLSVDTLYFLLFLLCTNSQSENKDCADVRQTVDMVSGTLLQEKTMGKESDTQTQCNMRQALCA